MILLIKYLKQSISVSYKKQGLKQKMKMKAAKGI